MNEAVAALTDLALALGCATGAALLAGRRRPGARLLAALGAAALLGALAHGSGECSPQRGLAFRLALLALGAAAALAAVLAARIARPGAAPRGSARLAAGAFALYALALASAPRSFGFAVVACLPGFALLLFTLARAALAAGAPGAGLAVLGLGALLGSTALQQAGVGLAGLDRNGLFHVLALLALAPLCAGLRRLCLEEGKPC
jgi:hypothetical protein